MSKVGMWECTGVQISMHACKNSWIAALPNGLKCIQ